MPLFNFIESVSFRAINEKIPPKKKVLPFFVNKKPPHHREEVQGSS
jgi:hypothetical protein